MTNIVRDNIVASLYREEERLRKSLHRLGRATERTERALKIVGDAAYALHMLNCATGGEDK